VGFGRTILADLTMISTRLPAALGLFALFGLATAAGADYPIMSHRYLADPAVLVTRDRVYVYCSNDDDSPLGGSYVIKNVVCVSTTDMKNWTDHGIVFEPEKQTTWAKKSWAPGAIERDGNFFLYFGNGGSNIGVVTAKSPTGPFTDPNGKALIEHRTPGVQPAEKMWLFDPGAFIDDDGQAYLYFGGNGDKNCRVVKLNKDMVSFDGPAKMIEIPNFFEAAWMHKRDGKYYLSYSSNPKAGLRIDYMVSDKPTEGFTYGGIVADQPPINNDNNHAAEFEFKGKWYHIYHNRIVAKEAGIRGGFRRNLALEQLNYNGDGTIEKVTYTVDGLKQIEPLNPKVRVEAETFAAQGGIETEPCSEGGMCLTDVDHGDWVRVRGVDFGTDGVTKFTVRAAASGGGGQIELRVGSADGTLIGTCEVKATGGPAAWKDFSCKVTGATGVQDLYLKFVGGNNDLFRLDHWSFE
jgi:arabinoxylan arabinofuranohydrolase